VKTGRLRQLQRAFTLVEVLVALLAMAILAAFAWQGLDSVLRSREAGKEAIDRTVRMATVMAQWEQDLLALHDTGVLPSPLSFDGQTLRLTRRMDQGVVLVTWSVRSGVWQRWVSPVYLRSGDLAEIWLRSQQFQGNEVGQLVVAEGVGEWQVYFHRGSDWSNAQSSGDLVVVAAPPPPPPPTGGTVGVGGAPPPPPALPQVTREQLPNAVRLVLSLAGGKLTRDVALGPTGN